MSFNKVNYENHKTKIMAENLNEIQDNLIKNNSDLTTKQNQFAKRMFNNTTGKNYLNETDIKEGYYGDTNSDWNTFYSDWSARCVEIKLEAGIYTMSSSVDNTNVIFERYAINGVITKVSGNSFTFSLDEDSKVYITWSTLHHTYDNMKTMIELGKIVTEYEPYVPVPGSNNMNLKYVTPEQFGAKGDRITNDFDALNKCINHAIENHEVVRAEGTYFIANNKLDLNIQDLYVFINRIISTSDDYCVKLQGSSNVIVINNIYSNGDGFVISTDENHLQSNSNYIFLKNVSSINNCFYKYSHDGTTRITYNNFNFLILGSDTGDCIKDFGGGGSNIFNGNNCYCYASNGHAINIKNNMLSIYKNFVLEHDVKYGIQCENATANVFENIRNTELADKITIDNDRYVIKFIGDSYGNEFKSPLPFIGVKNEINPFNIEQAQKKEMNTYISDCVVFNGTNVLKMNFLQKWLYYEDIPQYDIKRRLLNGDAYIVTYYNHTGIRLTHDIIRDIKQSLYKPYISDTYAPTIFNIKENTTIELNDFYFPLGISKIVIIQNDNKKAIVKDRHGNIIFNGLNKEDGRYELECIVEENNTTTGFFMDCFCFTGENDKWLEISNANVIIKNNKINKSVPIEPLAVSEIIRCGTSYLNHKDSLTFTNSGKGTLFDDDFNISSPKIDCSSLMMAWVMGIPYEYSKYAGKNNSKHYEYGIKLPTNPYATDRPNRYYTHELAHYFDDQGWCFVPDNNYSDIAPGDIIFVSFKSRDGQEFHDNAYMKIDHCLLVIGYKDPTHLICLHTSENYTLNFYDVCVLPSEYDSTSTNGYNNGVKLVARLPFKPGYISEKPVFIDSHNSVTTTNKTNGFLRTINLDTPLKTNTAYTLVANVENAFIQEKPSKNNYFGIRVSYEDGTTDETIFSWAKNSYPEDNLYRCHFVTGNKKITKLKLYILSCTVAGHVYNYSILYEGAISITPHENDLNKIQSYTINKDGSAWFSENIKIGGTSYDDQNAKEVATKEYVDNKIGLGNELKLIGETPITLNNDADIITLISKEECKYIIQSTTLSDFNTSVITYNNASRTNNKDYIEIESTSDATIWHQSYVNITISNLIVGEQYTLYIDALGISIDSTNHITNGYFTVFTSDMEIIQSGIYLDSNTKFSLPITPTTTSIVVRWFVADSTSFVTNCKARINNIYINKGIENSNYSSIINLSGTFIGEKEFSNIKSGVTITSTPICSVYSKEIEKESKPLSGKTVVCFGDSLFGICRGETSATSYIAEKTGATVYNVGFSGCRMSQHPTSGYNEFCMYALSDAIYNEDWTSQDNNVTAGGVDYFVDQLNVLKNIDFNKVDIIVIHYGTNDFGGDVEIGKDDTSSITYTLCGALRHSIENLLKKYPKIKIAISVPVYRFWTTNDTITYSDTYTNTNGDKLTDFVNALISVAKEYNLSYIDNYYCMGINKINASSFLEDGTHHNIDGRKRFGEFIGSQLISKL